MAAQARLLRRLRVAASYGFLLLVGLTMLAPFAWMASTALKEPGEASSHSLLPWRKFAVIDGQKREVQIVENLGDRRRVLVLDDGTVSAERRMLVLPNSAIEWRVSPRWDNFALVWQRVPFLRFYLNSFLVAICVTLGQVATSAAAAYAFTRLRFPARDKLFFGYLATLMIPSAVTMIPLFILLRYMSWIDTYWALIIPGVFSAYGTFMLRQFFLTLPTDLEDAARIDGCGSWGVFWHVVLPLSKPALATVAVFTFMGNWRSFMWPLVVAFSAEKQTLPVGLAYFQGEYGTDWTLLMAGSLLMIVPMLVVFMFAQRYFVEGIQLGALKG
jgi:multiple sugar transport system permease protein